MLMRARHRAPMGAAALLIALASPAAFGAQLPPTEIRVRVQVVRSARIGTLSAASPGAVAPATPAGVLVPAPPGARLPAIVLPDGVPPGLVLPAFAPEGLGTSEHLPARRARRPALARRDRHVGRGGDAGDEPRLRDRRPLPLAAAPRDLAGDVDPLAVPEDAGGRQLLGVLRAGRGGDRERIRRDHDRLERRRDGGERRWRRGPTAAR